jgi:hypothetical protein
MGWIFTTFVIIIKINVVYFLISLRFYNCVNIISFLPSGVQSKPYGILFSYYLRKIINTERIFAAPALLVGKGLFIGSACSSTANGGGFNPFLWIWPLCLLLFLLIVLDFSIVTSCLLVFQYFEFLKLCIHHLPSLLVAPVFDIHVTSQRVRIFKSIAPTYFRSWFKFWVVHPFVVVYFLS